METVLDDEKIRLVNFFLACAWFPDAVDRYLTCRKQSWEEDAEK